MKHSKSVLTDSQTALNLYGFETRNLLQLWVQGELKIRSEIESSVDVTSYLHR